MRQAGSELILTTEQTETGSRSRPSLDIMLPVRTTSHLKTPAVGLDPKIVSVVQWGGITARWKSFWLYAEGSV